jgi:hypothetical protein
MSNSYRRNLGILEEEKLSLQQASYLIIPVYARFYFKLQKPKSLNSVNDVI